MVVFELILIYWCLCIFGNRFIQAGLGGINTFYILIGISILYCLRYIFFFGRKTRNICGDMVRTRNAFIMYGTISFIYIILSYLNFFCDTFKLSDLEYDSSYIFRQAYVVIVFPIIFTIIRTVYKKPQKCINLLTNRRLLIMIWSIIIVISLIFELDRVPQRSLMFALSTLIFILNRKNIIGIGILLITIFTQISLTFYSSTILAVVSSALVFVFFRYMIQITNTNLGLKLYALISIIIVAMAIFFGNNVVADMNTMWRWQYWMNELKLVVRTKFIGVGFGTAYASNSILWEINNANMLLENDGAGIFYVTQHNSLINHLYRMGICGAIVFLNLFIICPIRWCAHVYNTQISDKVKLLLEWGMINLVFNIVICITNPGFESPRFLIGFIVPFSILLGFLYVSSVNYQER